MPLTTPEVSFLNFFVKKNEKGHLLASVLVIVSDGNWSHAVVEALTDTYGTHEASPIDWQLIEEVPSHRLQSPTQEKIFKLTGAVRK